MEPLTAPAAATASARLRRHGLRAQGIAKRQPMAATIMSRLPNCAFPGVYAAGVRRRSVGSSIPNADAGPPRPAWRGHGEIIVLPGRAIIDCSAFAHLGL